MTPDFKLLLAIILFCVGLAGLITLFAYAVPAVTSHIGHNW